MEFYKNELVSDELLSKINEIVDGREILFLTVHGSHLYGLNHADSDVDIKGVFLPTNREIILGNIPKTVKYSSGNDNSKNSKEDCDIELFSLNYFFELASRGDTGAISMLSAPENLVIVKSDTWRNIVLHKNMFYSKNMAGLIGFVRTQTDKYCAKGDRLRCAKDAIKYIENGDPDSRLKDFWNDLPKGDHIEKIEKDGRFFWSVCNRLMQDTSKFSYVNIVVKSIISSYGKRSQKAFDNSGLDFKAISHAFRVANELSDLYKFGTIKYPLVNSKIILDIKLGKLDFKNYVLPRLNLLMDEVNVLSKKSNFPQEVNKKKIDDFAFYTIKMLM